MVDYFGTSGLDFDYGQLIDGCMRYGIPVLKKNGETYAPSTLLRKLRRAEQDWAQQDQENREDRENREGWEPLLEGQQFEENQLGGRTEVVTGEISSETLGEVPKIKKTISMKPKPVAGPAKSKKNKESKIARAILQDSLIKAYLAKKGIKRVTGTTKIPLGIVIAVYGNQIDVGEAGLGEYLPNFLENKELKKYWQDNGVVQITPQTEVPARFIYLLDA